MRQMRVGVIGQSLDAVFLNQALDQLAGVEPVAIEVPEDPQDFVRTLRARRVSALVVCAPVSRRMYLIRKALDEGLPVLAETPWASELDSIAGLLEEQQQQQQQYSTAAGSGGIGHHHHHNLMPLTPWRFAPDLQLARGILAGGALGDPVSFDITLPGPEAHLAIPGDSPTSAALLVHQKGWMVFDLVRHLFGDVHTLQASRIRSGENAELEAVEIHVQCMAGWTGRIRLGTQPKVSPHWVRIEGREGRLELGWESSFFKANDGEPARIGSGCFGMENYLRLASAFIDVATVASPSWVNDSELIRTLELVQAANMSLGAGLAVEAPRRHRRIVAA